MAEDWLDKLVMWFIVGALVLCGVIQFLLHPGAFILLGIVFYLLIQWMKRNFEMKE